MSRQQIIILCACVSIFALGQFHRASGSVFTPILMDRYVMSAATVGGLVSAMFFASIVAQAPFGALLDRIGARPILTACVLLIAGGAAVFAVSDGYSTAFISRVMIGVGQASMGAATYLIIARHFTKGDFGYVSGLVVTLGGVGGMLGTYPLAFVLARFDWALVFGVVAAITVAQAVFIWLAIPGGHERPKREEGASDAGYLTLLRDPEIRKIIALGLMTWAPITAITGLWGGPYLQDVAGLSAEAAGAVLLIMFTATILGGYVFGLLDRRARSRRMVILPAAALSAGSLAVIALAGDLAPPIAIALLLVMIFSQQFYIPLGAHLRHYAPETSLARASTLLTLSGVIGIPLTQLAFGAILDAAGAAGLTIEAQYRVAFGALGAAIATSGLIYATARHNRGAR